MNQETKDQAQMSLLPGRFMGESLPSMDNSFSSLFCVVVTWLLRDDHVIGVNHWSAPEKAKRWRRKKRVKWVHENLVVLWLILVGSRGRSPSVNHLPQWSDIRWIGYSLQAGKIQTLPPTKLTQSQVKVRRRFLFFSFLLWSLRNRAPGSVFIPVCTRWGQHDLYSVFIINRNWQIIS